MLKKKTFILFRGFTWLPIVLQSHARWGRKLKKSARARRKTSIFFGILFRQLEHKKQNWQWIFSFLSVKFRETWLTGSKCFALVGARFSEKSIRPVFPQPGININLQKSKNLPLQTILFSYSKFVSRRIRCAVKILEDFTQGNPSYQI